MINETLSYSSAFVLGLLSSAHCIGMCGGITAALTFGIPTDNRTALRTLSITIAYNLGRIITYTVIGLLLGSAAQFLQNNSYLFAIVLRSIAGLMLIVMGLYISNVWQGLIFIEKMGQYVWRWIQPLSRRWLPITNLPQALGLGMIWGFLPCGLVYSVLIWAMGADSVLQSATIMFCFGLGTLPTLLTFGLFSNLIRKFIQARATRFISGLLIIVFGIWTLTFALERGDHHEHSSDDNSMPMEHMHH